MTSKINIRKAEKKDLAFVHNALCMLENEVLDAVNFKRIFLENIANPSFEYYVAEEEGKLIEGEFNNKTETMKNTIK